jgi:hypothetical protein
VQLTYFTLPCTAIFGLKVERDCTIFKVCGNSLDVAMVKKRLLDVLGIYVGGVNDINVTCLDKVEEVFLSAFPNCFAFAFGLGGIGGEVVLQRVVCSVVVGGGCGGVVWS